MKHTNSSENPTLDDHKEASLYPCCASKLTNKIKEMFGPWKTTKHRRYLHNPVRTPRLGKRITFHMQAIPCAATQHRGLGVLTLKAETQDEFFPGRANLHLQSCPQGSHLPKNISSKVKVQSPQVQNSHR